MLNNSKRQQIHTAFNFIGYFFLKAIFFRIVATALSALHKYFPRIIPSPDKQAFAQALPITTKLMYRYFTNNGKIQTAAMRAELVKVQHELSQSPDQERKIALDDHQKTLSEAITSDQEFLDDLEKYENARILGMGLTMTAVGLIAPSTKTNLNIRACAATMGFELGAFAYEPIVNAYNRWRAIKPVDEETDTIIGAEHTRTLPPSP